MPKKKKQPSPADQPSLYGEVDELYNIMQGQDEALKEIVEAAEKSVERAQEKADGLRALRAQLYKGLKIVERRREELQPKKKP